MRPILIAGLILAAALSVALMAPAPSAQTPPAEDDRPPMGKLYLNSTVVRSGSNSCGPIKTYAMLPQTPNNTTSRKAHFASSSVSGSGSCGDLFEFSSDVPFQLNGTSTLHFWFGCDTSNTILRTGAAGHTVRARLLKNATQLGTGTWSASSALCSTSSANITLMTKDAAFNASEPLRVEIVYWAQSGSNSNVHFKVEGVKPGHNSSLRARGLPVPEGDLPPPTTSPPTSPGANTTEPTNATANTTTPTDTTTTTPPMTTAGTAQPGEGDFDGDAEFGDDGGETKDISGSATPGPGLFAILVALAAALIVHRGRSG